MRISLLAVFAACLPLVLAAAPTWTPSQFTQAVIMGVDFVDAKTGFIAGGDNGVGSNALLSTDGGVTFTNVPIHQPAMMLLAVSTASAESAVIGGLGLLGGGTQYLNGSAFTNSSEPLVSLQQTQDAQQIGDAEGFALTGSFSFFGSNATINGVSVSADGGATFSFSDVGGDPNVPARYGSFPSTSIGFVASGTWPSSKKTYGKFVTRNIHAHFGAKKQYMHFEMEHQDVEPEAGGWAAAIFRSVDGFDSWTQVFSNDTYYFNEISCPSESVCFAVAENDDFGYAFRSTDQGETWEEILVAPGVSMMACHALSEDEVFLGGGVIAQTGINGHVYHTTDGGDTFQLQQLPNYYLTGLSFADSTHGWATAMNAEQQCNVLIYA